MLGCRLCRIPISALNGCGVCSELKVNLIDLDESETDKPALSDVASETVVLLRKLIKSSKNDLENPAAKKQARGADMALKASSAMAKVLEAARKLQQDGVAVIRSMSFIERLELFADWFMSLPPAQRKTLMRHLEGLETQKSLPAPKGPNGPDTDS